ncbi:hypothetical protein GS597_13530 [Synechococcales cyanobacterium C]|uniref:Tetratricopeptide repeat protein n=1 Tax=Petrachloros mirabilis ULC683 TaxID=2781853 RepID=A0A8K2A8W3_9CYAN|nr:hypothetical protein [Petrachloros mirabilis]NCJ07510.1 hypothetical protein [Petrachloros mirabilis ULC683]
MNQDIAEALARQDWVEAAQHIQALPAEDPWRLLYQGQLYEGQQEWSLAESTYRQLLQSDVVPKLMREARQGIQRIQDSQTAQQEQQQERIQQQIAQTVAAGSTEPGVLILDAIAPEQKTEAARHFATIMQTDPYTARLQLPSRGSRLYRSGAIGELQGYGQALIDAGIPAFWATLKQIEPIKVYAVRYFVSIEDPVEVKVVKPDAGGASKSLTFSWSEVSQWVEGQLPILEEVVDLTPRGKLQRKIQTQDHAQVWDLHLPQRQCILRFYDAIYHFHEGVQLAELASQTTGGQRSSWAHWQGFAALLAQKLGDRPAWKDFTPFAETAVDHPDTLNRLSSHIHLLRRIDSDWDPAFHLYSSLAFLRQPTMEPLNTWTEATVPQR